MMWHKSHAWVYTLTALKAVLFVAMLVLSGVGTVAVLFPKKPTVPPAPVVVEPSFWPERTKLEKHVLDTYAVYPQYVSYIFDSVEANSKKYKVPTVFILSVMQVESSFSFDAVSSKQCKGLMQINYPMWSAELRTAGIATSEKQLYDPKVNIEAGTYILSRLLKQTNNDPSAAMGKYFGADNKDYANKVMNTIGQYTLLCAM